MSMSINVTSSACKALPRSLAGSLLLLLSACASGYLVNGRHVSDEELTKYRSAWAAETPAIATTSAVAPKEHQGILDLIATLEAQGGTDAPPCQELVLTEIVRGRETDYVQFASGQTFGPLSFYEDWRVLACGQKHSWIALVGPPPRSELQVVYSRAPNGDWMQPARQKASSLTSSDP
ncbi:hypothetical protein [Steroidobacter gossypii]|nr:hypothetical protein [Steroidobacter gossypii]